MMVGGTNVRPPPVSGKIEPMERATTDSPVKYDEWHADIETMIDGLGQNLCRSAPKRLRSELQAFRVRLTTIRGQVERRRFECDLDSYVNSSPALRAAGNRWLRDMMRDVIGGVERLLTLTEKWKSANDLARKRRRK